MDDTINNKNDELIKEAIVENWDSIMNVMETQYDVPNVIIATWIRSINIYDVHKKTVYFYVDEKLGLHGVEYIHRKGYHDYLLASVREVLNDLDIEIQINEKDSYIKSEQEKLAEKSEKKPEHNASGSEEKENLNKNYTFENFVVGDNNKHAFATCVAVADAPCQDNFNPLFLYGGPGLGKTHLIQAIAHYIIDHHSDMKVLYVSSEVFTNDIITSIKSNQMEDFRDRYRQVDVLIIDDIQEIIGRDQTQREFFNTFNFLYDHGKQIVLSSDRPPKELSTLEERLRSRFEWGLPIDIHAPDYETRMAILKNKAKLMGIVNISEDIYVYIAENIVSNVRELEGALKKFNLYSTMQHTAIDLNLAKEILKDLISKDSNISITPEYILEVVAKQMNISIDDIKSKKRSADIALARQLVMYLSREMTDKSLASIGAVVGGKDHSTVFSGINRITEKLDKDPEFRLRVSAIKKQINPNQES